MNKSQSAALTSFEAKVCCSGSGPYLRKARIPRLSHCNKNEKGEGTNSNFRASERCPPVGVIPPPTRRPKYMRVVQSNKR